MKINHLYSKNLNIYGDLGNILALQFRAQVRGIECEIVNTELNEEKVAEADIYFIGGGQDLDQMKVFNDLLRHKKFIKSEVEKGKVFLLICGGYQLFGEYFLDSNGNRIEGLGILNIETKAPDDKVSSRCIGNIVVEMSDDFINHWNISTDFSKYLVGFENHGGQTFFTQSSSPIGKVISGFGNNSTEKIEGLFFKNVIGSYCHGSLLPKNPHLADAMIEKVVGNKIEKLEDSEEKSAHEFILNMRK